jgi:hypothetical protein
VGYNSARNSKTILLLYHLFPRAKLDRNRAILLPTKERRTRNPR